VITSDIRGTREQVSEAAVRVDPRSVESIADAMHRIWTDERLAGSMSERGRERAGSYGMADYRRRLTGILEDAKALARKGRRRAAGSG
jgi:glycosyltransferase involved in cell wall biosynthesis